jgi:hypothetical protein
MPQRCKVCSHEETDKINEEIINGVPNRRIAAQFNLKEQSIRRHKKNCLPEHLIASKQIEDLLHADALVERISTLLKEAEFLLNELKERGDFRGAVASLGEFRRIVEMLAKLGSELAEKQAINIHNDPAWSKIRNVILDALSDHPEAKWAVAIALEGVSNEH